MDSNFNKIALDLYGKIQTRFPNIQIGDEDANVLSKKNDIPKARFFEFEYEENGEDIGTITMTLDADEGLVVEVSGDIVDKKHPGAIKFIRSFRPFAKDRLLNFKLQRLGKSNLDKRDYQFRSQVKDDMIMENKLYGTSRMSYQDLGEARLIIKHNENVNLDLPAGRTLHIESIYIENAQGERFKYPAKHLNGARALAEHIKHGGTPYDGIGMHIIGLSEELASLRKFKGYVSRHEALSEAMGDITSKVFERIEEVKKEIHSLQRPAYYEQFAESFQAHEAKEIPEDIMNDWVDRLTIRTFNEDLKAVFPYIFKLVGEGEIPVKELSPDDLLGEDPVDYDKHSMIGKLRRGHEANNKGWGQLGALFAAGNDEKASNKALRNGNRYYNMTHKTKGSHTPGGFPSTTVPGLGKVAEMQPEDAFENFMDSIVGEAEGGMGVLDSRPEVRKQAIDQLNKIFQSELKGGVDNINFAKVKELIPNQDFATELDALGDKDLDARLAIKAILQDLSTSDEAIADLVSNDMLKFGDSEDKVGGDEVAAAPEAPAEPVAPEAPAEPTPAATPAPAAPVAEGDDDVPFEPDAPKKNPSALAGKYGQGHSTAKHLAKQGLKAAIAKAVKAGAKPDTELDFGHKKTTLLSAMQECGIDPASMGFSEANPKQEILKSISGFWNPEKRNFTIGGTRAKKKAKDAAEELIGSGADRNSVISALREVMAAIEKMDPSSQVNQGHDILRLAGVKHAPAVDEGSNEEDFASMIQQFKQDHGDADMDQLFQQFQQQAGSAPTGTASKTQTGTIDGKPASYDDAMSKFKDIAGGMGFDGSSPEAMHKSIQGKLGNMMQGIQGQIPNQNIQVPGGQINPTDMMKQIMGKLNFGK